MTEDRLILDRDVPAERERLRLGNNPIDLEEVRKFTLEAELERLSNLVKENKDDYSDERVEIRQRMKQAEEDKDKMSDRGREALDYLQSNQQVWNK
jgi:hypothetical protein